MKISLFGKGFVLGCFAETFSDDVCVVPRDSVVAPTPDILYGISTVHNYHVKDGEPLKDIETNLVHFMNTLHSSATPAMTFNLVSTWFVYGKTKCPAAEDSYCNPTGFYSITARTREQLLISYCETFGYKYRVLRLGNVIGIGDKKISRKKNALQYIVSEVAKGNNVDYLYEKGAVRDFIDVRDVAQAIRLVLEKGETNQIYNVANGKGLNINHLVDVAWQESGYKSKITQMPVPEFHKTVQVETMWMDVKKLKSLGYVQRYDIPQSVRELVHHYKHEKIENS